ncbi:hypothetical protein GTO91_16020 [Heliobacterium undosum]|uniref:Uncharacterized protein n=1 Tax=Heliomicrobium undosum TaxID=121734 RepID=A0A845L857_9FIRM|nr:hypothetical protein [Heliomicrobium undosum]MZP31215.1 hypothetical protein [Heliomicrobium undosum]
MNTFKTLVNKYLGPEEELPLKALVVIDNEKIYQDYMVDRQADLVQNLDSGGSDQGAFRRRLPHLRQAPSENQR